jgi:hypothetical protein
MERAVVEGALEAARKDNSRLQGEVAALRSTLRRGAPLDEPPVTPIEAANDEVQPRVKRVKNSRKQRRRVRPEPAKLDRSPIPELP